MRVCSYLFFSSVVLIHLFRRETWPCEQRGAGTGTLLSTSGRAVWGSRARYPLPSGTWWLAWCRRAWRDRQSPCGPRHGETGGGNPAWGSSWLGWWQEPVAPVCSSSEAKDPSFSIVGFKALTMQSKLIYLQFAAEFKRSPVSSSYIQILSRV